MHQLQHLTNAHVQPVLNAADASALRAAVEAIPQAALCELVAVMVLGRGDNGSDFESILENARDSYADSSQRDFAISYVSGKAQTQEYVRNGLTQVHLAN